MVTPMSSLDDQIAPPATQKLRAAADALHNVVHSDDVVEYTLRCVLALAPQLTQAVVDEADRHARSLFGSTKPYVARRQGDGRSERNDDIRRDYRNGERLPYLVRKYRLTERRICQILAESKP